MVTKQEKPTTLKADKIYVTKRAETLINQMTNTVADGEIAGDLAGALWDTKHDAAMFLVSLAVKNNLAPKHVEKADSSSPINIMSARRSTERLGEITLLRLLYPNKGKTLEEVLVGVFPGLVEAGAEYYEAQLKKLGNSLDCIKAELK